MPLTPEDRQWLEDRLTRIQKGYTDFTHLAIWILSTVVLIQFGIAGAVFFLYEQNKDRAREGLVLAQTIQQQRKSAIRAQCEDQNIRHYNTITALDDALSHLPNASTRPVQERRTFTILLIDAIAPLLDCDDAVFEATATQDEGGDKK